MSTLEQVSEKIKARMLPFGYVCSLREDADAMTVHCTPKPETFNRDRLNSLEIFLPKSEDTVNIAILSSRGYRMNPVQVEKIIAEWTKPQHVFIGESHYIEAEFSGSGARDSATAVVTDIIRERRKPIVLPREI